MTQNLLGIDAKHTSAQAVISMLLEDDKELQIYALRKLDQIVHYAWHEISDYLSRM